MDTMKRGLIILTKLPSSFHPPRISFYQTPALAVIPPMRTTTIVITSKNFMKKKPWFYCGVWNWYRNCVGKGISGLDDILTDDKQISQKQ
jgi:hypothetical protein